jgi:hypothetical protein
MGDTIADLAIKVSSVDRLPGRIEPFWMMLLEVVVLFADVEWHPP